VAETARALRAESRRKRSNRLMESWTSHIVSLLRSPARRILSRAGRQVLDRLEIELCDHGGNDNGRLPMTFEDLVEYGVHRNSVAPAEREVVALGFAEITRRGRGGNADYRLPNLWRLTYVSGRDRAEPTHEWRKIKTIEEAKAIAQAARNDKDPRAVWRGQQAIATAKSRNRYRKPGSSSVSKTEVADQDAPTSDSATTVQVRNPRRLSIVGSRGPSVDLVRTDDRARGDK
jgi:hypothetical protein